MRRRRHVIQADSEILNGSLNNQRVATRVKLTLLFNTTITHTSLQVLAFPTPHLNQICLDVARAEKWVYFHTGTRTNYLLCQLIIHFSHVTDLIAVAGFGQGRCQAPP